MDNMNVSFNPAQRILNTNSENAKQKHEVQDNNVNQEEVKQNTKSMPEKDVFTFMSAYGNQIQVKSSMASLINKYNSPEAQERIAAMMSEFSDSVVAGLAKYEEEMGTVSAYANLSEADKLALSAKLILAEE